MDTAVDFIIGMLQWGAVALLAWGAAVSIREMLDPSPPVPPPQEPDARRSLGERLVGLLPGPSRRH